MERSGAEIFIEGLNIEGVDTIFGYPGGVVLPIYDQIFKQDGIRHFLARHEQGAVHAADGYARSSGKVGVALVTSGPGATNAITGIATAYMDSIPLVVFTGQVPTSMLGNDSFQEADIFGISSSVTKHNYLVKKVSELPGVIREAFYIARTGRPGPVVVDLPKDILLNKTKVPFPDVVEIRSYKPVFEGNPRQIETAVELINKAKRPVVYSGGGVIASGAHRELLEFVNITNIPITSTLMGLGGIPGDHPHFLGMLGMHGTWAANMAVTECDLLIALGARFDDRVTGELKHFAPHAKVIHVDIDPAEISKRVNADVPVVGDLRHVLVEMNKRVHHRPTTEWNQTMATWQREHPLRYHKNTGVIKPQCVIEKISELTGGDAIICTEVGQNQMWTAQFYPFKRPNQLLSSGGLGTMGYGLPAAIGAQVANPDKVVFDIAGDGSIQMNIQELGAAVQYRLPVNIAILNNGFLGMVRQWQELYFGARYSQTCLDFSPDFVKIAEGYGALGIKVTRPEDVEDAIKTAIADPRPVVLDFHVDREENVFPMVGPGKAISDMLELGD